MADRDTHPAQQPERAQPDPHDAGDTAKCDPNRCDPAAGSAGPVREAGGTTGAGNLSPGQASRTGGATAGVGSESQVPARDGQVPPSA
jgi:hypothetical protein